VTTLSVQTAREWPGSHALGCVLTDGKPAGRARAKVAEHLKFCPSRRGVMAVPRREPSSGCRPGSFFVAGCPGFSCPMLGAWPSRVWAAGDDLFSERKGSDMIDTCDNCGLPLDGDSHFSVGKTWCARCWSGQRPPEAMPPTPAQKRQLALWCQPRPQQEGRRP